jgi:dihydroxy-acid dehydratase
VTDGIAMGHAGHEVVAGQPRRDRRFRRTDDARPLLRRLVGLAGCDKTLPGMMMSMVRLNVPSVFIYGGSILPGRYKRPRLTVQDVFEAVGKFIRRP